MFDKIKNARKDAQDFIQKEMIKKLIPMVKKFAPKAKEGMKEYLVGDEKSGEHLNKRKQILIDYNEKDKDVRIWVFQRDKVSVDIESEDSVLECFSVEQMMEKFLSGGFDEEIESIKEN